MNFLLSGLRSLYASVNKAVNTNNNNENILTRYFYIQRPVWYVALLRIIQGVFTISQANKFVIVSVISESSSSGEEEPLAPLFKVRETMKEMLKKVNNQVET